MPVVHYMLVLLTAFVAVKVTTLTLTTLLSWTAAFFTGYLYTNKQKNYPSIFIGLLAVISLGAWDIYRRYKDEDNTSGILGPTIATVLGASFTALTGAAANTIF